MNEFIVWLAKNGAHALKLASRSSEEGLVVIRNYLSKNKDAAHQLKSAQYELKVAGKRLADAENAAQQLIRPVEKDFANKADNIDATVIKAEDRVRAVSADVAAKGKDAKAAKDMADKAAQRASEMSRLQAKFGTGHEYNYYIAAERVERARDAVSEAQKLGVSASQAEKDLRKAQDVLSRAREAEKQPTNATPLAQGGNGGSGPTAPQAQKKFIERVPGVLRIPAKIVWWPINNLAVKPFKAVFLNKFSAPIIFGAVDLIASGMATQQVLAEARRNHENIGPATIAWRSQKGGFGIMRDAAVGIGHYVWNNGRSPLIQGITHPGKLAENLPTLPGKALNALGKAGDKITADLDNQSKEGTPEDPKFQAMVDKKFQEEQAERRAQKERAAIDWKAAGQPPSAGPGNNSRIVTSPNNAAVAVLNTGPAKRTFGNAVEIKDGAILFVPLNEAEVNALIMRDEGRPIRRYTSEVRNSHPLGNGAAVKPVLKDPSNPHSYVEASYGSPPNIQSAILVQNADGTFGLISKNAFFAARSNALMNQPTVPQEMHTERDGPDSTSGTAIAYSSPPGRTPVAFLVDDQSRPHFPQPKNSLPSNSGPAAALFVSTVVPHRRPKQHLAQKDTPPTTGDNNQSSPPPLL